MYNNNKIYINDYLDKNIRLDTIYFG